MNKHSRCAQSASIALLLGVLAVSVGSVAFAGYELPRISQERIAGDPAAITEARLPGPDFGCRVRCRVERDRRSQACVAAGGPTRLYVSMCLDAADIRYRECLKHCPPW